MNFITHFASTLLFKTVCAKLSEFGNAQREDGQWRCLHMFFNQKQTLTLLVWKLLVNSTLLRTQLRGIIKTITRSVDWKIRGCTSDSHSKVSQNLIPDFLISPLNILNFPHFLRTFVVVEDLSKLMKITEIWATMSVECQMLHNKGLMGEWYLCLLMRHFLLIEWSLGAERTNNLKVIHLYVSGFSRSSWVISVMLKLTLNPLFLFSCYSWHYPSDCPVHQQCGPDRGAWFQRGPGVLHRAYSLWPLWPGQSGQ